MINICNSLNRCLAYSKLCVSVNCWCNLCREGMDRTWTKWPSIKGWGRVCRGSDARAYFEKQVGISQVGTARKTGGWHSAKAQGLSLHEFRLNFLLLIVWLPVKLDCHPFGCICLKYMLPSLDLKTLLMHCCFFPSFFLWTIPFSCFQWLSSFHTVIAFSNDIPLFLSSLPRFTPYPQALALAK